MHYNNFQTNASDSELFRKKDSRINQTKPLSLDCKIQPVNMKIMMTTSIYTAVSILPIPLPANTPSHPRASASNLSLRALTSPSSNSFRSATLIASSGPGSPVGNDPGKGTGYCIPLKVAGGMASMADCGSAADPPGEVRERTVLRVRSGS
jgi:hypothetical protein